MKSLITLLLLTNLILHTLSNKEVNYIEPINKGEDGVFKVIPPSAMTVHTLEEHQDVIQLAADEFMATDELMAYKKMEQNTIDYLEQIIDILMSPEQLSKQNHDGSTAFKFGKTLLDAKFFTTATTKYGKGSIDMDKMRNEKYTKKQLKEQFNREEHDTEFKDMTHGGHSNGNARRLLDPSNSYYEKFQYKVPNLYGNILDSEDETRRYCRSRNEPAQAMAANTAEKCSKITDGKFVESRNEKQDTVYVYNWKKSIDHVYLEVSTTLNTVMKPTDEQIKKKATAGVDDDLLPDNVFYKKDKKTEDGEMAGEYMKCQCVCGQSSDGTADPQRSYWFGWFRPEVGIIEDLEYDIDNGNYAKGIIIPPGTEIDGSKDGYCKEGQVTFCKMVAVPDGKTADESDTCLESRKWCRRSHVDNEFLDRKVTCENALHSGEATTGHSRYGKTYNGYVYIRRELFDDAMDLLIGGNSRLDNPSNMGGESNSGDDEHAKGVVHPYKFYQEAYKIFKENLIILKPGCADPIIPMYPPIPECLITNTCTETEPKKCDRITQWISKAITKKEITVDFNDCLKQIVFNLDPVSKIQKIRWNCVLNSDGVTNSHKGEVREEETYQSGGSTMKVIKLYETERSETFNAKDAVQKANNALKRLKPASEIKVDATNEEGVANGREYSLDANNKINGYKL